MQRTRIAIVLVVASILIASSILIQLTVLDEGVYMDTYGIEVERSTEAPTRYTALNQSDIGEYPLIADVLDAFDNPGDYPGVTLEGNVLFYRMINEQLEDAAVNTTDYLENRLLVEYGEHVGPPYSFSYTDPVSQETLYYLWYLTVS